MPSGSREQMMLFFSECYFDAYLFSEHIDLSNFNHYAKNSVSHLPHARSRPLNAAISGPLINNGPIGNRFRNVKLQPERWERTVNFVKRQRNSKFTWALDQ